MNKSRLSPSDFSVGDKVLVLTWAEEIATVNSVCKVMMLDYFNVVITLPNGQQVTISAEQLQKVSDDFCNSPPVPPRTWTQLEMQERMQFELECSKEIEAARPVYVAPEREPFDLAKTLSKFERTLEIWESTVNFYSKSYDCDEEYGLDIQYRADLHCWMDELTALNHTVPEVLMSRLKTADARFMEITCPSGYQGNSFDQEDATLYWYYYRLPNTLFKKP